MPQLSHCEGPLSWFYISERKSSTTVPLHLALAAANSGAANATGGSGSASGGPLAATTGHSAHFNYVPNSNAINMPQHRESKTPSPLPSGKKRPRVLSQFLIDVNAFEYFCYSDD